ncbi:peptide ABC transporter permease [Actinoplanes sp. OR16]|uniref:ABC transporter permease n=1 Tax=Actinoplanes sp. OR16 TaxID=946334 RepID=UPI000F6E79EA|nr:ABC transporter permease [Actinoplanes sp. OR16]BBH69072.1 peptide ABC transporter permease [Actinoplanes sp. OR16]
MGRFLLSRAGTTAVTLWGLATAVFLLMKLLPGDQATMAAGRNASPEQIELFRERLGLDEPLPVQYVKFLGRLLHGDFGQSAVTLQPVVTDLRNLMPSTVELVVVATVLSIAGAVLLALVTAARQRRDTFLRVAAVAAGGVPVFWLAFLLQWVIGTELRWLPVAGQISTDVVVPVRTGFVTVDALLNSDPAAFGDALLHLILPALVLALPAAAGLFRTLRASMLSALESDYVSVARSKGVPMRGIVTGHVLRNAAIPSVSLAGLQVGWTFAGVVLVESVFGRQGIGSYLTTAVTQKDTQAVFGAVLFIGLITVLVNFAVDVVQLGLDPRVRRAQLAAA